MFAHHNNLLTKVEKDYKKIGKEINNFLNDVYLDVKEKLLKLDYNNNPNSFIMAAQTIDSYLKELDDFSSRYSISSQSKFRSSFLEEICVYLFSNFKEIKNNKLGIFNKRIYAGIQLNNNLEVYVLTKDVDFCIGNKVNLSIDGKSIDIIVPAIAIEVKTYLDGTMFNEVMFSGSSLKNATSTVKTYVLMEYKDLSDQKIFSARSRNEIDEMFVLKNKPIDNLNSDVLKDFYDEIISTLKSISKKTSVKTPGKILRP